jgi:hypothetical protein
MKSKNRNNKKILETFLGGKGWKKPNLIPESGPVKGSLNKKRGKKMPPFV